MIIDLKRSLKKYEPVINHLLVTIWISSYMIRRSWSKDLLWKINLVSRASSLEWDYDVSSNFGVKRVPALVMRYTYYVLIASVDFRFTFVRALLSKAFAPRHFFFFFLVHQGTGRNRIITNHRYETNRKVRSWGLGIKSLAFLRIFLNEWMCIRSTRWSVSVDQWF